MRTINLHLDADAREAIAEHVGMNKFMDAIGYLSTWNMNYPTVDIYPETRFVPDMTAVYRNVDGTREYTIGAVWHDDHYGFHS